MVKKLLCGAIAIPEFCSKKLLSNFKQLDFTEIEGQKIFKILANFYGVFWRNVV